MESFAMTPNDKKKSPTLTPKLRLLFWESTAGCNLRCVHCRRLDVMETVTEEDLSTAEGMDLIGQVAEFAKPIMVFSGGEPLMRGDIFDLAAYARDRGLKCALATNGTRVDEEMAKRIRDTGFVRVAISLDGAKSETHDSFRGLPGSHAKAVAALSLLKSLGLSTQINFTVARHNAVEIPDIYRMALSLGAHALHFFMLVPVGCGVSIADKEMLSSEEYERWLEWLHGQEQLGEIELKATCAPHYFRVVRQGGRRPPASHHRQAAAGGSDGPPALHQVTRGCLAGSGVAFVSHKGDVFPCGYLPIPAGNVRRERLKEIWEKADVFRQLRDPNLLKGKCGECQFKIVCGGCRARAYGVVGDWLAEEPFCAYDPGVRTHG